MRDDFPQFRAAVEHIPVPHYGTEAPLKQLQATAITILDSFSQACFSPVIDCIPVSRVDFVKALDYYQPQFLLLESAWNGNDGAWKHQLVGPTGPKAAVKNLVAACNDRSIPVVFWNKEDPPHFEDFLPLARLADHVFTTAGELVDQYKFAVGHENVHTLPFAAQPSIHHPFADGERDREVCFAGQYFRHKYPERREQMEFLFPAAAEYDFTIYSRELGNDPRYAFPEPFDELVSGSVPYALMIREYRHFKTFLNVNSVVNSKTMCARRIFEISASGATVVSAPSPAIERFYQPDEVFTPNNLQEAQDTLQLLLTDEPLRQKSALKAWRRTMINHTYTNRVDSILHQLGLAPSSPNIQVAVVIDARGATADELRRSAQIVVDTESIAVAHYILADRSLSLSDTQTDLQQITEKEAADLTATNSVIVASPAATINNAAFSDILLAISSHPDKSPVSKAAFNALDRPAFSANVVMSPLLWATAAGALPLDTARMLFETQGGVFNALDYFNMLDRRQAVPAANSTWEV